MRLIRFESSGEKCGLGNMLQTLLTYVIGRQGKSVRLRRRRSTASGRDVPKCNLGTRTRERAGETQPHRQDASSPSVLPDSFREGDVAGFEIELGFGGGAIGK